MTCKHCLLLQNESRWPIATEHFFCFVYLCCGEEPFGNGNDSLCQSKVIVFLQNPGSVSSLLNLRHHHGSASRQARETIHGSVSRHPFARSWFSIKASLIAALKSITNCPMVISIIIVQFEHHHGSVSRQAREKLTDTDMVMLSSDLV